MKIAIIDSGGANINSVRFAFRRLGVEAVLTDDAEEIAGADRVVLPGVGAAAAAMEKLHSLNLIDCILNLQQPVLGICLGMQLLYEASAEGRVECLGIIPGKLTPFQPSEHIRVPHMGWNSLIEPSDDCLLKGLPSPAWFYFVHGYMAPINANTLAACEHGQRFTAVCGHRNFRGVQFHPERSSDHGTVLLRNFLEIPCN